MIQSIERIRVNVNALFGQNNPIRTNKDMYIRYQALKRCYFV